MIGTSAGGMDALTRIVAQFPEDFSASVFIVRHMEADTPGTAVLYALKKSGRLKCSEPEDGEAIKGGHIYLAPTDHHMMITKGKILVTKGAAENRWRPGIDPLFRSARLLIKAR